MARRHGISRAGLQPLGVLIEHRVHDVNERFVTAKEAMSTGQQVALQPALAHVLTQELHYAAVGGHVVVDVDDLRRGTAISDFKHGIPAIRRRFIRTEDTEVVVVGVELHHISDEDALNTGGLDLDSTRCGDGHGIIAEVGQA